MRDRLIEILNKADKRCDECKQCEQCVAFGKGEDCINYLIADTLLANGVIVPPCKVGDTVYFIQSKQIFEGRVILIRPFIHKDHTNFHGNVLYECINPFYNDGRTMEHQISVVFEEYGENTIAYLTKEEAEKALERSGE